MKLIYKLLIIMALSLFLSACGGSDNNNDSDSSYSESHTTDAGVVYQCDTESAYNSCSGDGDCSSCTCTENCDSADQDDGTGDDSADQNNGDTCEVDGRNVTVPDNSSCIYNGETATCTNGRLNYLFFDVGGAIDLQDTIIGGEVVNFRMECSGNDTDDTADQNDGDNDTADQNAGSDDTADQDGGNDDTAEQNDGSDDTADQNNDGACSMDGRVVNVPNNGSCTFNGETATCTNGSINFLFFTAGSGVIELEQSNINGTVYDGTLTCTQ